MLNSSRVAETKNAIGFAVRSFVKGQLARMGLEIRRVRNIKQTRPFADMRTLLEDAADRGLRCETILDVGANRGDWSRLACSIFSPTTTVLIEPQSEMRRYLDSFCAEQPGRTWIEAGAAAEPGELSLSLWGDMVGSSFLAEEGHPRRTVPVITIDSIIDEGVMTVPDLAKLDVQGFELEVLKGATKLFGRTELFILETSFYRTLPDQPLVDEVIDFMTSRGYRIYDVAGYLRRPSDGAVAQIDLCFAPEDGVLRSSDKW